jgi:hypothetical protein
MNSFEDSLLTELRTYVATRAASRPAVRRRRIVQLGLTAIPVGTAAAVGIAAVFGPSPAAGAYAVTRTGHGDVVVTITKLSDAAGLQNALRADGIDAYVNYDQISLPPPTALPGGTPFASPRPRRSTGTGTWYTEIGCSPITPVKVSVAPDAVTFDIPANDVNTGIPLHITTAGTVGAGLASLQIQWQCTGD